MAIAPEDLQGWSLWRLQGCCWQRGLYSVVELQHLLLHMASFIPSNKLTGYRINEKL